MKRKVVCICKAFNGAKHFLGTGSCDAAEWAASIFQNENSGCKNCNCNNSGICEVSMGAESLKECLVYQNAKNDLGFPKYFHPVDMEKAYRQELNSEEYRYG